MVFPFGVSVSDFIAGVKLFKDAIDSLSKTRGARADFAELSRSLNSLERALKALTKVKLDTDQRTQALQQNLDACKLCVATFLVDIAKFRTLDVQYATKARLVMNFRQIQWALCKREDVKKFRSEIEMHIGALEMLLITFQIESAMRVESRTAKIEKTTDKVVTQLESCALELRGQSNVLIEFQRKLQTGLSVDEQRTMFNLLQETFRQNEGLRNEMKNLQTQNSALVNHVLEIKDALRTQRNLPSQVLLQQPVILHDALGRIAPFHLEFIDSVAAFLAVLQIRFEHVGRPKVTRLEFDLRDTASQSQIALRRMWKGVFHPGQHVDMSMMFALSLEHTSCPGCHYRDRRSFREGQSVQCQKCHILYRYGIGQNDDRIHFLGDDGISDLLASEDGDCNVSDFCRVSIVEPAGTRKDRPKPHPLSTGGSWTCPDCGTSNSGLTPDFCPICGLSWY